MSPLKRDLTDIDRLNAEEDARLRSRLGRRGFQQEDKASEVEGEQDPDSA